MVKESWEMKDIGDRVQRCVESGRERNVITRCGGHELKNVFYEDGRGWMVSCKDALDVEDDLGTASSIRRRDDLNFGHCKNIRWGIKFFSGGGYGHDHLPFIWSPTTTDQWMHIDSVRLQTIGLTQNSGPYDQRQSRLDLAYTIKPLKISYKP
nr:hypothetical protein CFP56_75804 [Quercus suber]